MSLSVQKVRPSQEKNAVNAALVNGVIYCFGKELSEGVYISDGERSIFHETHFQVYFEKCFGFRKAYCRLYIRYRPDIRHMIACLYFIRGLFETFEMNLSDKQCVGNGRNRRKRSR